MIPFIQRTTRPSSAASAGLIRAVPAPRRDFYAVLTGRNPTRSSFTGGLDRTQAKWLAEVAKRAVPDRARLR
jgi:hypothetical protein